MIIREKSTGYLTAAFRDKLGRLSEPASIRYRIDCLTTGTQVRPWTELASPMDKVEITLTPTDNAIFGSGERERRLVTVVAAYEGSDDQVTNEFRYDVLNLKFVS